MTVRRRTAVGVFAACLAVAQVASAAEPRPIEVLTTPTALEERLRELGRNGKNVVVHFFAMWCEPCRDELPTLAEAAKRLPADVPLVLVSLDPPAEGPVELPGFLGKFGLTATTTYVLDAPDPTPVVRKFSRTWSAELPATFVWRDGKPRAERLTPLGTPEELAKLLAKAATPVRRGTPLPSEPRAR